MGGPVGLITTFTWVCALAVYPSKLDQRPEGLLDGGRGAARSLQIRRGPFATPADSPIGARLSLAGQPRQTPSGGLRRTWCVGPVALRRGPSVGRRGRVAPRGRAGLSAGCRATLVHPRSDSGQPATRTRVRFRPASPERRGNYNQTLSTLRPIVRESGAGPFLLETPEPSLRVTSEHCYTSIL